MNSFLEFAQNYTYFIGVVVLGLFWLAVFLEKKVNRREMLITGVLFGVVAVVLDIKYSFWDYWHPNFISKFYIENFLYGFFLSGICTQIYFAIFKNPRERVGRKHHPIFVLVSSAISVLAFLFLVGILRFNSIVPMILPPLFVGLYIAYKSHRTLQVQIWTGAIVTIMTFFVFKILLLVNPAFVVDTWHLQNLSGLLVSGIPLEEYLFAFSLGFGLSLAYDYIFGRTLVFAKVK